jgi:hypothetical protein
MPLVGSRMHGYAGSTCFKRDSREPGYAWPGQITPVPQLGDGIDVDAEARAVGHGAIPFDDALA